jgi:hypothetical protein
MARQAVLVATAECLAPSDDCVGDAPTTGVDTIVARRPGDGGEGGSGGPGEDAREGARGASTQVLSFH